MTKRLDRHEMLTTSNALQALHDKTDSFELSTNRDGWKIKCFYGDNFHMEFEHSNLWYLVNIALDNLRSKLVFSVPVPGDDFTVGEWVDYSSNWHRDNPKTCQCGAYAVKIRGWAQKGTPCRKSEYQCKHGHRWTGWINCD